MKTRAFVLTMIFLMIFGITQAQENDTSAPALPLDEVAEGAGFSVRYPEGWTIIGESGRSLTIASREGLQQSIDIALPPDEIVLEIGTSDLENVAPPAAELTEDVTPTGILEAIIALAPDDIALDTPEAISINDQSAAIVSGDAGANAILLIVWELNSPGVYGTVAALTGSPDFTQFESTLMVMAESLYFTGEGLGTEPPTQRDEQAPSQDEEAVVVTQQAPAPAGTSINVYDTDTAVPVEKVREFFMWYLSSYTQASSDEQRVVPIGLITGALLDHIQQAGDQTLDPVTCSTQTPTMIDIYVAGLADDEASSVAQVYTDNATAPIDVQIDLIQRDQQWLINAVSCALTPDTVAELVFTRYGNVIREAQRTNTDVALFDDASGFAWDRYMTETLIEQQNALDSEDLTFNPFLCAQDVPAYVSGEIVAGGVAESDIDATVSITGYYATGTASYEGIPLLEAELLNTEDGWKINVVSCITQ